MRAVGFPALIAVVAGAVFVTACGTQAAGVSAPVSGSPVLPGDPEDLERDGVRITGMSGWTGAETPAAISADFEVANRESEPFTYTVTFGAYSASGEAEATAAQTVPAVGAGQTVKRTVRLSAHSPGAGESRGRVGIVKVRRVPTDEAPAENGRCPSSGVRLTADEGNAAMGLRVVGLHLTNCGTGVHTLNGSPSVQPLDEDRKPVPKVKVFNGSGGIATMADFDAPARPVTLQPGETAYANLMWRNTNDAGSEPVNAPYVRVKAKPGAQPIMVTPELDLGTTGRLAISPWRKTPAR